MLEREHVRYLRKRVLAAGGEMRKVSWEGRSNAPDWLVLLPGVHFMVETKRSGKAATEAQGREHERLRRGRLRVYVANSNDDVDEIMDKEA